MITRNRIIRTVRVGEEDRDGEGGRAKGKGGLLLED